MSLLSRIPIRLFWLSLIVGASAFLFSLALAKGLDAAGVEGPRTTLDVLSSWQHRVEQVRQGHAVAYLGDSTALSDRGYKHTIPGRIAARLSRDPSMPSLVSLADAGLGPVVTQLSVRHVKPNLVALTPSIVITLDLGSVDEQLGAIAVVDPDRHKPSSLQIVIKRLSKILA